MTTFAYLRGSKDDIDLSNQKSIILDYANEKGLSHVVFIEDIISAGQPLENRKIHDLIWHTGQPKDIILVAEVSRLARSTLEVLRIAKEVLERDLSMYVVNQKLAFDGSIQTEIFITFQGMAAQIERHFIKERTQGALDKRKKEIAEKGYFITKRGEKRTHLGNPKGSKYKLKIFNKKDETHRLVSLGVTKINVCRIIGCSYPTLMKFLQRYPVPDQIDIEEIINNK